MTRLPGHTCPAIDDARSSFRRLAWRAIEVPTNRDAVRERVREGLRALEQIRAENTQIRKAYWEICDQLHAERFLASRSLPGWEPDATHGIWRHTDRAPVTLVSVVRQAAPGSDAPEGLRWSWCVSVDAEGELLVLQDGHALSAWEAMQEARAIAAAYRDSEGSP